MRKSFHVLGGGGNRIKGGRTFVPKVLAERGHHSTVASALSQGAWTGLQLPRG